VDLVAFDGTPWPRSVSLNHHNGDRQLTTYPSTLDLTCQISGLSSTTNDTLTTASQEVA
jgi:hypothetical protein